MTVETRQLIQAELQCLFDGDLGNVGQLECKFAERLVMSQDMPQVDPQPLAVFELVELAAFLIQTGAARELSSELCEQCFTRLGAMIGSRVGDERNDLVNILPQQFFPDEVADPQQARQPPRTSIRSSEATCSVQSGVQTAVPTARETAAVPPPDWGTAAAGA